LVIRPSEDSFSDKTRGDHLTASNLQLDVFDAGKSFRLD
jgi:hypothetical protein